MEVEGKSDVILIKEFFYGDAKSSEVLAELKALPIEDRKAIGEGIRNGSLTY